METRKIASGGFFVALGVLFPMLFHMVSMAGPIFLPMHIPVLLAGFILGGKYGFAVGLLTPVISCVFTGMPPLMPIATHHDSRTFSLWADIGAFVSEDEM